MDRDHESLSRSANGSNRYRMNAANLVDAMQVDPSSPRIVPSQPAAVQEPAYVEWMRSRQLEARRHQPVIAQRHAKADQSESPDVHGQDVAWAERHAHERRLHDSAMAHLRHG
ncbi:MAG: hypothetical protein RLZZ423_144 [Cyanobacteriota bacterium]